MEYFLVVEIVDGECDLCEPVEYLGLSEVFAFFLHVFDFGVHVTELAVYHDDAEVALVIGEGILVGDDVDVAQFLQNLELVLNVLPLLLIDLDCLYLLQSVAVAFLRPVLAQKHISRRTALLITYPVPISFPTSYTYIITIITAHIQTHHRNNNPLWNSFSQSS